MNSSHRVIAKFGGQSALARMIGKGPSTVQHWAKTGMIPSKWQNELLDLARAKGIDLSPSDFMLADSSDSGSPPEPPTALYAGVLPIGYEELPCYVLDDGRRVISRTGATSLLTERKGGGNLESYIRVQALQPYLDGTIADRMIEFRMPEVVNKTVRGMSAEDFLDICKAYVQARDEGALSTPSQFRIAIKAGMFLSACAKTGLIALIDEATGYQYERADDALRLKLQLYLEEEMRKWEKTFPDELWIEFGRLSHWDRPLRARPKYWGKLIMELVYEYLDPDVTQWLKQNAPAPRHGQNYHQWLSSQYGLKKLMQHLWMLVGIAKTCNSMYELREKMAVQFGREPVQLTLFLSPPALPRRALSSTVEARSV